VAFEPLAPRSTHDQVVDALRSAILSGYLAPGRQLREVQLAGEFGISRAPLREAMRALEEDGLLVKRPYRGSFVATVDDRAIDEIAGLRRLVEPYAMQRTVARLQPGDLARLREWNDTLRSAARDDDIATAIDAHLQLHRFFYEHADHDQLAALWRGWESQLRMFLAEDLKRFLDPDESADAHGHLLDLIESEDWEALKTEAASHIHDTTEANKAASADGHSRENAHSAGMERAVR
jgi:DNA-binding GntR family transcriptional regulator